MVFSKTHLAVSRYIKTGKDSLPLDVHHPKTPLLELPSNCISSLLGWWRQAFVSVSPLVNPGVNQLVDQWTFQYCSPLISYFKLHLVTLESGTKTWNALTFKKIQQDSLAHNRSSSSMILHHEYDKNIREPWETWEQGYWYQSSPFSFPSFLASRFEKWRLRSKTARR